MTATYRATASTRCASSMGPGPYPVSDSIGRGVALESDDVGDQDESEDENEDDEAPETPLDEPAPTPVQDPPDEPNKGPYTVRRSLWSNGLPINIRRTLERKGEMIGPSDSRRRGLLSA